MKGKFKSLEEMIGLDEISGALKADDYECNPAAHALAVETQATENEGIAIPLAAEVAEMMGGMEDAALADNDEEEEE